MSDVIVSEYPENRQEMYELLEAQLKALTEGISSWLPNLANASALIWGALDNINWAGFYVMKNGELLLGPFQGKTACVKIPLGKGVCGTAAASDLPQVVVNVHEFPGHIACDSNSNSEIVLPLHSRDKVVGVLDIDSPMLARFDDIDLAGLMKLVNVLENSCDLREFE